jgi:hypothetical protein
MRGLLLGYIIRRLYYSSIGAPLCPMCVVDFERQLRRCGGGIYECDTCGYIGDPHDPSADKIRAHYAAKKNGSKKT